MPMITVRALALIACAQLGCGLQVARADVFTYRDEQLGALAVYLRQSRAEAGERTLVVNGTTHRLVTAFVPRPATRVASELLESAQRRHAAGADAADELQKFLTRPELVEGDGWYAVVRLPDLIVHYRGGEQAQAAANGSLAFVIDSGGKASSLYSFDDLTPEAAVRTITGRFADRDVPGEDSGVVDRFPGTKRRLSLTEHLSGTTHHTVAYVGAGGSAEHCAHYGERLSAAGHELMRNTSRPGQALVQSRDARRMVTVFCRESTPGRVIDILQVRTLQ
jgi:hypothetical protein